MGIVKPAAHPPVETGQESTSQNKEIDRCQEEILRCEAELRKGNPDVSGAMQGLFDWRTEKRLIEQENEC